nr:lycopene cyclase family protein [Leptolyngbya sp. CCY15150]
MGEPVEHRDVADAVVIGAGPAGLSMAAELGSRGLRVIGLTMAEPTAAWPNTYGIWCDELESLLLADMLGHRWHDCVVYTGSKVTALNRDYGLIDKTKLQTYFLDRCDRHAVTWHQGTAAQIDHKSEVSCITTQDGTQLTARIVVDASGHRPALVQRPPLANVAYQAAYGIVGRFSKPPIRPQQFVLMDYRADHLTAAERAQPPTFLYAMDLGDGVYFVEETSLAHSPAIAFEELERRLHQRLAHYGVAVTEVHHTERCLFPMNLPMPFLDQPVVGFGGAASMVHPASGYMVGSLLRRGPIVAEAIAQALNGASSPQQTARAAWQALWSPERLRKYYLYRFGLSNLLAFDEPQLNDFFHAFFQLSKPQWSGFLADTLTMPELMLAMVTLFGKTTNDVRQELLKASWSDRKLLWRSLLAQ